MNPSSSSVHSRDDIIQFYVDALPDLGWVWDSKSGKTLEQGKSEYVLRYRYEGSQPLYSLRLEARKDATVSIYVTHVRRSPEDLSLFVGHVLELGQDKAAAYDVQAIPRPPDSVIAEWSTGETNATILYRCDWEKHSMADRVRFYVHVLPDFGWTWGPGGGKPLEQAMADRRLHYRIDEGVTLGQGAAGTGGGLITVQGGDVTVVQGGDQVTVGGEGQAAEGGGAVATSRVPTPTLPAPFQHVRVTDKVCASAEMYVVVRMEKLLH